MEVHWKCQGGGGQVQSKFEAEGERGGGRGSCAQSQTPFIAGFNGYSLEQQMLLILIIMKSSEY